MKKLLLSLLVITTINLNGQVLLSEDFNALNIGNVGTDITGATPGQGNWLTFATNGSTSPTSTNASNASFQVISGGANGTNGVKITTPNAGTGSAYLWKGGFPTLWTARTSGNNIVNVSFDFFTGSNSTSKTLQRFVTFGSDASTTPATTRILNGFQYNTETRVLAGLATLNNAGAPGLYTITLATGGLVLTDNTWYKLGFSYNSTNGQPVWRVVSGSTVLVNNASMAAADFIGPYLPIEIDFYGFPSGTTNTVASDIVLDNILGTAASTVTLSNENNEISNINPSIYPNPATDILNISGVENITSLVINDINGRTIKTVNNASSINVADLNAGVYFINIATDNGNVTKKFMKN